MRNVKDYQIKHCIAMGFDDFDELVREECDDDIDVSTEFTLVFFENEAGDSPEVIRDKVKSQLSKYFDVNVIAFHAVGICESPLSYSYTEIWIEYE